MEEHKNILEKLCRVCGKIVELKVGYRTAKSVEIYSNILYTACDIDVEQESDDIYPKIVCNNCKKKLDRLTKKCPTPRLEHVSFYPHLQIEDCDVCASSTKTLRGEKMQVKQLDQMMANSGFIKCDKMRDLKRVYVRQSLQRNVVVNDLTIFILDSLEWYCQVYGQKVSLDNELFKGLPRQISNNSINEFCIFLKTFTSVEE